MARSLTGLLGLWTWHGASRSGFPDMGGTGKMPVPRRQALRLKVMRRALLALGLLAAAFLAGCGGSSGGTPIVPAGSLLEVTENEGYNGSTAPIEGGSTTTTQADGHTFVTYSKGVRTVNADLPTASISDGQSFPIGGEGGAVVTVTEVQNRDSVALTWVGTSGSVTVHIDPTDQTATIELHSATFQGDATIEGNLADGSFTLVGNVLGVEFSGGGNVGGVSDLVFSQVSNLNASIASLNAGLVVYAHVENYGVLTVSTGTASNGRILSVNLRPTAVAGDQITLNGALNSKASITFAAGNGNPAKVWLAKSGTLKILARSASTAKVELVNAAFSNPSPQTGNAATGTFTLNGTLETD